MPKRREPGHYEVGIVSQTGDGRDPRPRRCGTYGVIKGENIAENGHIEWRGFCSGIIKQSKWCAYRSGPDDGNHGTQTELLQAFDSKGEAVDWVKRKHGRRFTEEY
jgi:hypothetical protein